jgi:hypothetical protein
MKCGKISKCSRILDDFSGDSITKKFNTLAWEEQIPRFTADLKRKFYSAF